VETPTLHTYANAVAVVVFPGRHRAAARPQLVGWRDFMLRARPEQQERFLRTLH
jgi:hypothetical protein